jgi:hypothetical protein
LYLEYFELNRPSPAWATAQNQFGLVAVCVRGPAHFIQIGDWLADCQVASVVVTIETDMVGLSLTSSSRPVGYVYLDKYSIVSWEALISINLAKEVL